MISYRTNWIVDKPSDGLCSLRIRVKWCNSKNILTFALPFKIEQDKWIQSAQRVKPNTTHGKNHISASDINRKLQQYETAINSIFEQYDDVLPTKDTVRIEFEKLIGKTTVQQYSISELITKFISEQQIECQWTDATVTKFNTLKMHIDSCCNNYTVDSLNHDTMISILNYFVDGGYRNTYTNKMLKFLKTFVRWAVKYNYLDTNVFDEFKPRLKGAEGNSKAIVYLTWEELQMLYNFEFRLKSHTETRDVFCFCAFSGLRYSDVAKLRQCDIGTDSIFVVTQKTTDALTIELNDYTKEILERYKTDNENDFALPVISNQKYNEHLKEIGKLAGIDATVKTVYFIGNQRFETNKPKWELLTSHVARRTFVVNALYLGISPTVIMKWTGHSDYDSMKPYIEVVDELKKNEMSKFNRH